MKKFLALFLVGLMVFGCVGCAKEKETDYDLGSSMSEMTDSIKNENKIMDIDAKTLSSFFAAIDDAKFRIRGMVTDYAEKNIIGLDSKNCKLVCDGLVVDVYFNEDQEVANGEYIEVVGELLTISGEIGDGAAFSLNFSNVVERGASVRERIEGE